LSSSAGDESLADVVVAMDTSLSLPGEGVETVYGMSRGGFGAFNSFFEGDIKNKFVHPDDRKALGNMMGWGGWGGSVSSWDREKNVAFAYVPNAMGLNLIGGPRSRRILLELQKHM
jgi:CubicO group peptidase (beta-lactamase class C family)